MLLAAMLAGAEATTSAEGASPDLRMLMNLDLFEPRPNVGGGPNSAPANAPADDSMLDQIRTLDAMGYLGRHASSGGGAAGEGIKNAPRPGASGSAPGGAHPASPTSPPAADVEGPEP